MKSINVYDSHATPFQSILSTVSEMLASSFNDDGMGDGHNDQTNGECAVAQCSTASTPKDIKYKFNIHHKYTTHNIVVSDRSTIGKWACQKQTILLAKLTQI